MDERDAEIVRLLQTDARQSYRELARKLDIAPSTCMERIRTLTRRGVIRGYHADISLPALNRGVQGLVSVKLRVSSRTAIDAFKDFASRLPEVLSVYVVSGDDDFIVHVAVQDLDHLHAFLTDRVSTRKEVAGFRTSVVFQQVRNPVLERLEDPDIVP
ncbi:Lrp/AsnC family transcriptional regulator [Actinoallomurus oryzae]|uniref:Lrp/AsnC family transcriptional regulator n=1 Tax=Actinoallomurus oryzae TaxID=502180 RepID=A0ABP8QR47_9ACTN